MNQIRLLCREFTSAQIDCIPRSANNGANFVADWARSRMYPMFGMSSLPFSLSSILDEDRLGCNETNFNIHFDMVNQKLSS